MATMSGELLSAPRQSTAKCVEREFAAVEIRALLIP